MASVTDKAYIKALMTKAYDILALPYAAWTSKQIEYRAGHVQKLIPHLEKLDQASVLELGCGAGDPTTKLLAALPQVQVTANDISETQISLAKQHLPSDKVTFRVGDMMDLTFGDGMLDAVVAMYSVLHLPRDEQTVLLERIHKWLKPGGLLLVNLPVAYIDAEFEKNWLGQEGGDVFFSSWGMEGYDDILKRLGFRVMDRDITDDLRDASFVWYLAVKPED